MALQPTSHATQRPATLQSAHESTIAARVKAKVWLELSGEFFAGDGGIHLLGGILRRGSLAQTVQFVAVVGDPGVGKSRLVLEITRSSHVGGWLVLEAAAVPYGRNTPYLRVIQLLKNYCGVSECDDQSVIREKVTGKLLALDPAFEVSLAAFLSLLDLPVDDRAWLVLDPAGRRRRTLASYSADSTNLPSWARLPTRQPRL